MVFIEHVGIFSFLPLFLLPRALKRVRVIFLVNCIGDHAFGPPSVVVHPAHANRRARAAREGRGKEDHLTRVLFASIICFGSIFFLLLICGCWWWRIQLSWGRPCIMQSQVQEARREEGGNGIRREGRGKENRGRRLRSSSVVSCSGHRVHCLAAG